MTNEQAYNAWADQYDSNLNKTRDLDAKVTRETLAKFAFSQVLELGCGTGKNTSWLLTKAKHIIGLDFSEQMLAVAREKITDHRVKFKRANLNTSWEIENESVDLITSSLTLEHIADLNHIFDQTHQKLKTKGLFFICELHPFKQYQGSKARFETENGMVELEVFTHHITDYLQRANQNGFELVELKEWFDANAENQLPRLISFVFRK